MGAVSSSRCGSSAPHPTLSRSQSSSRAWQLRIPGRRARADEQQAAEQQQAGRQRARGWMAAGAAVVAARGTSGAGECVAAADSCRCGRPAAAAWCRCRSPGPAGRPASRRRILLNHRCRSGAGSAVGAGAAPVGCETMPGPGRAAARADSRCRAGCRWSPAQHAGDLDSCPGEQVLGIDRGARRDEDANRPGAVVHVEVDVVRAGAARRGADRPP